MNDFLTAKGFVDSMWNIYAIGTFGRNCMNIKNRFRGTVFGVALGDSLGGPLEFMKQTDIRLNYGIVDDMLGGGWLELKPGEATDDTAMTVAVMKGILENWETPINAIGKHFIDWFYPRSKDIGINTRYALESYKNHGDWMKSGVMAHEYSGGKSAGNGTLMRCAPIAFLYKNYYDKMIEVTVAQSKMTHYDDLAAEACCINNHIIWELLQNKDLKESIQTAIDKYDLSGRYKDCLSGEVMLEDLNPTAFVVDTLRCSLYCLLNTKNYFDAVVMAVNLGGDADTIGAVTGGLAGACYGYASLPAIWVYKLKCFDDLDELCNECINYLNR